MSTGLPYPACGPRSLANLAPTARPGTKGQRPSAGWCKVWSMREKNMPVAVISLAVSLGLPVAIGAHHGTNISYDRTTTTTIKGVVTEFWYRNPHPALFINVTDEKGTATRWTIEIAPTPYTLALRGWGKGRAEEALKPGTAVSAKIHVARAGTPVGLLDSLTNDAGVDILGEGSAGPPR